MLKNDVILSFDFNPFLTKKTLMKHTFKITFIYECNYKTAQFVEQQCFSHDFYQTS